MSEDISRKPQENPLGILFDYLDEGILNDPKKLSELARRQRRMLLAAYHPEANIKGPFPVKEAENRFKKINDSKELENLADTLGLVTGEKPESYQGESKHASMILEGWIKDYKMRRETDGGLHQENQRLLKQAAGLADELREVKKYVRGLEGRLKDAETRASRAEKKVRYVNFWDLVSDFFVSLSGKPKEPKYKKPRTDIPDDLRAEVEDYLRKATNWTRYSSYELMCMEIKSARRAAQKHNIDFDSAFEDKLTNVIEMYITGRLTEASSYIRFFDEFSFKKQIDLAIQAANEFNRIEVFKSKIEETVKSFIHRVIEKGKEYLKKTPYLEDQANNYFEIARNLGNIYGIKIDLHRKL